MMRARKRVGRPVYSTPGFSAIWFSLSFSGSLHPWPNPPTDKSHPDTYKLPCLIFPCHDFASQDGFLFLAVVLRLYNSWAQFPSSCRYHDDLECRLLSSASGLQDSIQVLGIEAAKSAGSLEAEDE